MELRLYTRTHLLAISLNPCFNGLQMERVIMTMLLPSISLNPCFNGLQMEHEGHVRDEEYFVS